MRKRPVSITVLAAVLLLVGAVTFVFHLSGFSLQQDVDMQALIASADSFPGPGILVPARNGALFRWCLANGLRIVQPLTLMTLGLYNEPAGAWLPSILF